MQIIKPKYYDEFHCIADKCSFTCCRDWHIGVDCVTKAKWGTLSVPDTGMAEKEKDSRTNDSQSDFSKNCKGDTCASKKLTDFLHDEDFCGDVIKLNENGKCPFLQEDKLCSLVLQYGEGVLSHTCHTFPRQKQEYANRIEHALSLGCPEVIDLLWKQGKFALIETETKKADMTDLESEEEIQKKNSSIPECNEVFISIRDWFIMIMSDKKRTPQSAMNIIFYLALDLLEKEEDLSLQDFLEYYQSDIVTQVEEAVKNVELNKEESFIEQMEIFLDITENYRKKKMYTEDIEPLAKLAEEYLDKQGINNEAGIGDMQDHETYTDVTQDTSNLQRFETEWKVQEDKIRSILCEELYAELLTVTGDLYSMALKLQWFAMEYAAMKTMFFLQWKMTGKLEYAQMRQLVVILFRMMGYSEDDIEEYLENSFESVIWEWGYFSLVIGCEYR